MTQSKPISKAGLVAALAGLLLAMLVVVLIASVTRPAAGSEGKLRELVERQKQLDEVKQMNGGMSDKHQVLYDRIKQDIASEREATASRRGVRARNSVVAYVAAAILLLGVGLLVAHQATRTALITGGLLIAWYAPVWALMNDSRLWLLVGLTEAAVLSFVVYLTTVAGTSSRAVREASEIGPL